MKEFTIKIYNTDDVHWVECEELRMLACGNTFKKIFKELGEELDTMISHYGVRPDDSLSDKAIEFKKLILSLLKEGPEVD
jgi:hypothetical protein